MGFFQIWQNRKQVLGMNERNLMYVRPYNSAKAKRIADDKLLTKRNLVEAEIPTPKLIGALNSLSDLYEFDWDSLPRSFVIKPVSGLEGGGIEIFYNRDHEGNWIKADGSRYSLEQIKDLAADIIDGKYSLHNQPDRVFFEERVRMHKSFLYYAYKGVPDIRIVVFNSIPIMAMLRLPTRESDGKGNLQMGAVGAGIDISTGVTTSAVVGKSRIIETIPGTKLSVSGLKIPYWNKILEYSVAAQRKTGLMFAGIDFLVDRDKGPMIIELNARPGLSIQLANQDGLRWRLRKAKGIKVQSAEKGVRLGKDLFGGSVEEDIERISGKFLIGIYEDVVVFPYTEAEPAELVTRSNNAKGGKSAVKAPKEVSTKAKIDTGADSTSIDIKLAEKLGYKEVLNLYGELITDREIDRDELSKSQAEELVVEINQKLEEAGYIDHYCEWVRSSHGRSLRLYLPISIELGGLKYQTKANVYDRSKLSYKVIVGRKSLSRFLVEPFQLK